MSNTIENKNDNRKDKAPPNLYVQEDSATASDNLQDGGNEVKPGGKRYTKADVFKFVGLLVFFVLVGTIVLLIWPYIQEIFTEGGVERVLDRVRDAGAWGVLILLGMQFLQIVVAFIPGEVTQIAAGLLYGPWLGALIILVGCVISSAFIYTLVHKLGAPFVQGVVPTKYLDKFQEFEKKGRLSVVVFILFLIPGLPKDTFTYLVPLTNMRMRLFLVLSNVARIPGILVSTYAADGFAEGRIVSSIIIFSVGALLCILGLVFREKLMDGSHKLTQRFSRNKELDEEESQGENDKELDEEESQGDKDKE